MALLYEYCRMGMLRELRMLLEAGEPAEGYEAIDGSTCLVMAARCGHGQIVDLLLAYGADAQVRTGKGSTALHHAVSGGSFDVVNSLIAAGVEVNEPNQDGIVPLFVAVTEGSLAMVSLLCDKGAAIDTTFGLTAFEFAEGEIAAYLESLRATRACAQADMAMAAVAKASADFAPCSPLPKPKAVAAECQKPHTEPINAPMAPEAEALVEPQAPRPCIADFLGDFIAIQIPGDITESLDDGWVMVG